ncbi:MAG: hypothetical protein ACRDRB_07190 [Pseudonocardiaceae bacterium]
MTCLRRCEVQRAQIGMLHARRLRGRIARVLTTTGGRRADDTLRRAVLALGSDLAPNPVLLTNAARRATELGDLALTERLARASVAAGGGFEPRLILGNALAWSGRGAEADTEFAVAGSLARNDAERAHAADRVANLAFALGRPSEAEAVFDILLSTVSDDAARLELGGIRTVLDAFQGRTVQAANAATDTLADPRCSPAATHLAEWGLAMACGGLGRLERADAYLQRVGSRADPVLHQATLFVLLWLRGFLLAGVLDRAEDTARRYRERCQDTPGPADVVTRFMYAEVARSHGQVKTVARWCRQVIAGIQGADFGGVSFLALVSLTSTLGMAGDATSARATLAEMTAARHLTFAFLEPERLLAAAWPPPRAVSARPPTPPPHTLARTGAAPRKPPPPALTAWRRPAKAPAPPRWPRSPRHCR